MPQSYWCSVVALVGLIALTGASPPNESKIGAAPTHKTKQIPSSPAPAALSENFTPYPDRESNDCYQSDDHERSDLCAQWRAALAAEKATQAAKFSNWISSAGALLSFVSILFVVAALRQARDANRISAKEFALSRIEARKAAAHAERALNIASAALKSDQEVGQAQVRAYITLADVSIVFDEQSDQFATVRFSIINTGNSPAHRTEVYFGVSDKGLVGADTTEPTNGVSIGTLRQMGNPRKAATRIPYPIFPGTALPGNAQILLRAFVSFEDVFDEVRLVDFDFGAIISIEDRPDHLPLSDCSMPDVSSMFIRHWKRHGPDAQKK